MRALLQRVNTAEVKVDNQVVGKIGRGYLIFLGVGADDSRETVTKLWQKISKLRIFPDENGKINLNLAQVGGEVLVVSQFTLWADTKHGNRPSFIQAARPQLAQQLYEEFISLAQKEVAIVAGGIFGADMAVTLTNDGPFTLWLDTEN